MDQFSSNDGVLRVFRRLLLLFIFSTLIGAGLDLVLSSLIPESLASAQAASEAEQSSPQVAAILLGGLVLLVLFGLAWYGLYRLRPWAPRLALAVSVFALLAYPLLGVSLFSGWAMIFVDLANTAWGAILALVFLSPLKTAFVVEKQA